MNAVEVCAVLLALAYVILAIQQRRICWIAAIASAMLYSYIFWQVSLYLEAVLQIFYIAMAVYGWSAWGRQLLDEHSHHQSHDQAHDQSHIQTWTGQQHLVACITIVSLSLILGWAMQEWTDAALPFFDAATTVCALLATWMVTQRLLENWLYWIAINTVSIGLYLSRDLSLTAALFAGYVILAIVGYRTWRRQWLRQHSA
ncbi:nicotinamide riboside transporter PnuC [Luminiphilus sp.]|nr:nicotinamide riboside transporter PnuC [Luminiphilus sp.]